MTNRVSATDIDRLLVSFVYNFHIDREIRFLELVIHICMPKMSPKIGNFEFSWIISASSSGILKLFGPAYAL